MKHQVYREKDHVEEIFGEMEILHKELEAEKVKTKWHAQKNDELLFQLAKGW